MLALTNVFFLFLYFSRAVSNAVSPCKLTDDECLERVCSLTYNKIMDADPHLGTDTLDPMYHDFVDGNLSILKFKLYNTTVRGFRQCTLENAKLPSSSSIHFELMCPSLKMHGKYDIKGRLIVLPIEGNGDFEIDSKGYNLIIDAEMKITEKDNKHYMTIKQFKLDAEPLEAITYNFKNLFNGQKELANAVLKFANDNWRDVSREVQTPVMNADVKKIITNVNKYFKHVPLDDIFTL